MLTIQFRAQRFIRNLSLIRLIQFPLDNLTPPSSWAGNLCLLMYSILGLPLYTILKRFLCMLLLELTVWVHSNKLLRIRILKFSSTQSFLVTNSNDCFPFGKYQVRYQDLWRESLSEAWQTWRWLHSKYLNISFENRSFTRLKIHEFSNTQ